MCFVFGASVERPRGCSGVASGGGQVGQTAPPDHKMTGKFGGKGKIGGKGKKRKRRKKKGKEKRKRTREEKGKRRKRKREREKKLGRGEESVKRSDY